MPMLAIQYKQGYLVVEIILAFVEVPILKLNGTDIILGVINRER